MIPASVPVTARKKCPCRGSNLEKYMQPIILHILSKEALTGYMTQKRIGGYATFQDSRPDMTATYRYLKKMSGEGLLEVSDGLYRVTDAGLKCLENWKITINRYTETLAALNTQLNG